MSKLFQVRINKNSILFSGVGNDNEMIIHRQKIDGSCDDEKWFDLVCEFWNNDCELDWEEVEKLRMKEKSGE